MKTPNDYTGGSPELPVSAIVPDPKNRKDFTKEGLRSLADSIKADGLQQAIVVRPFAPGKFMIVAGERRWRAHLLLKARTIPVKVLAQAATAAPSTGDVRKRAAENFQREDLNPIDEARIFRELAVEHKLPHSEIAIIAGKQNPSYVSNSLRMLECPGSVQEKILKGELTRAHGVALARFGKWSKACELIAKLAVDHDWSSRNLEQTTVPFAGSLVDAGLAVAIRHAKIWPGEGYAIPAALAKDPAFIENGHTTYCLEPEKWQAEKERQDKARAAKQVAAAKTEQTKSGGMSAAQKAERARKIASNLANRIETERLYKRGIERLKAAKSYDGDAVVVLAEAAFNYKTRGFVKEVAAQLNIPLPSGWSPGYGGVNIDVLAKVGAVNVLRLVAGAVLASNARDDLRNSFKPSKCLVRLGGKGGAK